MSTKKKNFAGAGWIALGLNNSTPYFLDQTATDLLRVLCNNHYDIIIK